MSTSLQEILAARTRIAHLILRTPVIEDPAGTGLILKAEYLQRTGSFKLRGASNRVLKAVAEGARHVVTGSSGNHGQAVAYVARELGIKATVVVPEDANPVKVRGMQQYGATVEFCGLTSTERLARAAEITRTEGAVFVPPYDDPFVMAGQGTAGLEILEQVPDVTAVYVPIGGGGLISGVATAIKESNPQVRVIGVEPELANDTYLSRQRGEVVDIGVSRTIADGLRTSHPGSLTFPVVQRYVDEIELVSEAEIRQACRYLLHTMKQVVEPSGAVSVAAALRAGRRAVALVSGGNVDLDAVSGVPAWEA
ncbi:MAG TPA: threonine/serine dehydratase [Symbiobacteriaceae bacterium]|nr:threonine/serine dehydratase [Symbiobacteriaceae bacterium]